MPPVFPYVPETITVHLGPPDESAQNVTVSFPDYIKNVVSSEIFPTWEPAALRANTLAIISFALNRVYTEFYRSRGYPFDITSSTAIDQKFIQGRNIYENISELVDQIFNDYLRRENFIEPLAAKFCNGTTVTCEGLSQWGSQEQAQAGVGTLDIIHSYYGSDVEVVLNAPVQEPVESYPGTPLREGDIGVNVARIQTALNRVSQNYPAIPKVTVDAVFGPQTTEAVRAFQSIFSLTPDGIVGRATWYKLVLLYDSVQRLAELQSEGVSFSGYSWEFSPSIAPGETNASVTLLQYMLSVLSQFISTLPAVTITGTFDESTGQAVRAFQEYVSLPATGVVDQSTWQALYSQYAGIEGTVFSDNVLFPFLTNPNPAPAQAAAASAPRRNTRVQPVFAAQPLNAARARRAVPAAVAITPEAARFQSSTRFVQFPVGELSVGMQDQKGVLV
ncbi:MAG: peptidoglycan-binding protein [Clostridiales bacterium]|nr:peptidoglycan-binding protein [Clostridiales bacterium]